MTAPIGFEFIGWPTEGVEYWNAFWRGQAAQGFFNDIDHEVNP